MTPISWLEKNAHGFVDLNSDERRIIMEFTLLWGLFEVEVLGDAGTLADRIGRAVARWTKAGLLDQPVFAREVGYFRHRYHTGKDFTRHFEHLRLERSGSPAVVPAVLSGQDTTPASETSAVLIIVGRFRNNLFHGQKWSYALKDQHQNFEHANSALIRAIELNRRTP